MGKFSCVASVRRPRQQQELEGAKLSLLACSSLLPHHLIFNFDSTPLPPRSNNLATSERTQPNDFDIHKQDGRLTLRQTSR